VRLELHTGVNTGEVIAGNPDLSTSLIVGDAVNLAARLEQAAGPGEILLGRGAWRLVRDAVEVEPPRVLAIPGRRDGEPAYRLLAVRPGTAGRARRHDARSWAGPRSWACSSGRTSGRPAGAPPPPRRR
jgi:class 3 adenylate cyclase